MYKSVVLPLFSSPVAVYKIDQTIEVKTDYEFIDIQSEDVIGTYISKRKNILDDYPLLKKVIIEHFNDYKIKIFSYTETEFKITTSWLSKTEPDGRSQFHKHSNAMFSAVYYFNVEKGDAPLQFKSNGILTNYCLPVFEQNIYNQDIQSLYPEKNYLIFFPSYLDHRIGHQKRQETRYSLACNFFPVGELGFGDSYINLEIK